jgi:Transposase DDE domain
VFRLALRQTEGLIGSIIGLLGLNLVVLDHTTLCRRAETLEVPRLQRCGDDGGDAEPVPLLVDRNARVSIERIRKVMHVFKNESGDRTMGVSSRKLWHTLHEVDGYLSCQSRWRVNYANDVVAACVSERRSPKARRTSSSIGG